MSARSRNEAARLRAATEAAYQINEAKPKSKRGGKRAGAGKPKGYRVTAATREKLRTTIDAKRVIGHLDAFMSGEKICEPHQITAGIALLKKVMPDLAATDITSGGEPLTIERVAFKP